MRGCREGVREDVEMWHPWRWESLQLKHPHVLGVPRGFLRQRGTWRRKERRLVIGRTSLLNMPSAERDW